MHLNPVRARMLKAEERLLSRETTPSTRATAATVHLGSSKAANRSLHRCMRGAAPPAQARSKGHMTSGANRNDPSYVTYDKDLLELGKPFGVEILRPSVFLKRFTA